ncbi:MAG: AarF/ABC1/UbiB kinase family protein [Spirochaetes bacterium]|nr:AarF/ABC1/UbiB kinase family protein [Spirochaetota bacterium]
MNLKTYAEIRRLLSVTSILVQFSIDLIVSYLYRPRGLRKRSFSRRMVAVAVRLLLRRPAGIIRFQVRLRQTIERLGPTYVKLGQIMSLREDLLPRRITYELRNLQTKVPPISYEEAKQVVESEFNVPLRHIYKEFAPKPVGAASLAQAHIAYLRNGQKVVVKVQRPGIIPIMTNDLRIMKRLAWILQRIPYVRDFQPQKLIQEFSDYTMKELDFNQEGKHADIFRENFKDDDNVILPKVYWEYTTKKILTLEFIEGVKPDDSEKLKKLGINGPRVAALGARVVIKQLFIDGFFHGDPHPGNLFIVGNEKFCMIDLGMTGQFTPKTMNAMFLYYYYLIIRDFETASKYMVGLTETIPNSDIAGFRAEIEEIGKKWIGAGFKNYSLGKLILNSMNMGARYKLYFNKDIMLAIKAIVTIEAVGYILDPNMNLAKVSLPMMSEIFIGRISPMRMAKPILRALPDYLDFIEQAPATLLRTMGMVSSGKFQIEMVEKTSEKRPSEPPWKLWLPFTALAVGLFLLTADSVPGGDIALTRSLQLPVLSLVSFGVAAWYSLRFWRMRRA